jgi:hypothetical protein
MKKQTLLAALMVTTFCGGIALGNPAEAAFASCTSSTEYGSASGGDESSTSINDIYGLAALSVLVGDVVSKQPGTDQPVTPPVPRRTPKPKWPRSSPCRGQTIATCVAPQVPSCTTVTCLNPDGTTSTTSTSGCSTPPAPAPAPAPAPKPPATTPGTPNGQ